MLRSEVSDQLCILLHLVSECLFSEQIAEKLRSPFLPFKFFLLCFPAVFPVRGFLASPTSAGHLFLRVHCYVLWEMILPFNFLSITTIIKC